MTKQEYRNAERELFERMASAASVQVKHAINEQYDNMLLEEFNSKEFINKILTFSKNAAIKGLKVAAEKSSDEYIDGKIDKAIDATERGYAILRKVIVTILVRTRKSKGYHVAVQFMQKLKDEVQAYVREHNTIPFKVLLMDVKTIALAMGLVTATTFGTLLMQSKEQVDQLDQPGTELVDIDSTPLPDEADDIDRSELDAKNLQDVPQQMNANTPSKVAARCGNPTMAPSDDCREFIKEKEVLCQIPYFGSKRERANGTVTIGYGHVICDNWKDSSKGWYFPDDMPMARRNQIKKEIIRLGKAGKIQLSIVDVNSAGQAYNSNTAKGMKDLVTTKECDEFFEKDLQIADRRVKITLGLVRGAAQFDDNGQINKDVANYLYYTQQTYDMMLSAAFNCGAWTSAVPFVKTAINCRYDKSSNRIHQDDYTILMQSFKDGNGNNVDRRKDEFKTFAKGYECGEFQGIA